MTSESVPKQVLRPAAYCVIYNAAGEVLLTEWERNGRGGWTLPGGGLDFGESPADAAIREVHEETGYHVALIGEPRVSSQHFAVGEINNEVEFQALRFVYPARILGGELGILDVGGTTTAVGWFTPEGAAELPLTETATAAMRWFPFSLVSGVDHVQLAMPMGEEAVARAYWCDVVGLTEVAKPEALQARGGAHFSGVGFQVHLGVETPFTPARKAHPAFRCIDIDAIASALTNAGHEVRWSHEIPSVRRFHTDDPFGNRLEFTE